ncbi:hypothetical protein D5086_033420 [Populus alba]|uniref:Uncharacterized protein n=1 Tax=Populus alba TaxID=43335 RepID=A0ACC4AGR5_POPAL
MTTSGVILSFLSNDLVQISAPGFRKKQASALDITGLRISKTYRSENAVEFVEMAGDFYYILYSAAGSEASLSDFFMLQENYFPANSNLRNKHLWDRFRQQMPSKRESQQYGVEYSV